MWMVVWMTLGFDARIGAVRIIQVIRNLRNRALIEDIRRFQFAGRGVEPFVVASARGEQRHHGRLGDQVLWQVARQVSGQRPTAALVGRWAR